MRFSAGEHLHVETPKQNNDGCLYEVALSMKSVIPTPEVRAETSLLTARGVRYEPEARRTIGAAKMLRFPRVNGRRRIGHRGAPSWLSGTTSAMSAKVSSLSEHRTAGCFHAETMGPMPNASIAAKARRARAASHLRCRNISRRECNQAAAREHEHNRRIRSELT